MKLNLFESNEASREGNEIIIHKKILTGYDNSNFMSHPPRPPIIERNDKTKTNNVSPEATFFAKHKTHQPTLETKDFLMFGPLQFHFELILRKAYIFEKIVGQRLGC